MKIIKDFNISDVLTGKYAIHCKLKDDEDKVISLFEDIFDASLCDYEKYKHTFDNDDILTRNNLRVFKNKIIHSGSLISNIVLAEDFIQKFYGNKCADENVPKKLIRSKIIAYLKDNEWEYCNNIDILNDLFALKVKEELSEIILSGYSDVYEFTDLLDTVLSFAKLNGYHLEYLLAASKKKSDERGLINKIVLTNLNTSNPSNDIYFKNS